MTVGMKRNIAGGTLIVATLIGCQWSRTRPLGTAAATAPSAVAATPAKVPPTTAQTSVVSAAAQPLSALDNPVLVRGMQIYVKQCAACHGAQGLGDGPA